ncbi:MAG: carbohydrate ABC transporter permease [Clostridia bacterium]|nr:carbohydrate ABC transporter permease [Clostridia bacterium]
MNKLKFKRTPLGSKIIYICFFVMFVFFAFLYLYPLVWAFLNSFKSMKEYATDSLSLPDKWIWKHYIQVFTEFQAVPLSGGEPFRYMDMLFNSLWILVVKVFVNVASSMLLAYALAKFRFPGSKFLYTLVIFANTIPIIGAGPAAYRLAMQLGMVNNPALIWLMWAGGFDFAFIVLYGYFKGVSPSYSESAKMDGASNWTIFIKVVLPQVTPCLAAIAITQATGVWNDYSTPMIYMRDYPNLAYGMYLFKDSTFLVKDSMPIYFASAVISCLPVIILYTCSQNLILNNMTTGGLKG